MPETMKALRGSCAMISCRFTVPSKLESHLHDLCEQQWSKVVHSGDSISIPIHNLGKVKEKDCSIILDNRPPNSHYSFQFSVTCDNELNFTFLKHVQLKTEDSMSRPTITPYSLEVEDGTPVTLTCSALAPCPFLPPNLTWTPSLGNTQESGEHPNLFSVMNFTASYLHHEQLISCAALYPLQAVRSRLSFQRSVNIRVLYSPKNTLVTNPGPQQEGNWVNLTCHTNANPAVNSYTWYKTDGDQVTAVGLGKRFTTRVSEDENQFYCKVGNRFGTQNSSILQMDVQFPPKDTSVNIEPAGPILEGISVTLTCSSRANPTMISYTWYKDDEEHKDTAETGQTLFVNRVDQSHSRTYRCVVKNKAGEAKSTMVQLDVQCKSFLPKNDIDVH
ncbi:hypothetical protein LDENG_00074490 [Lucifuga dentata]|nr:hypothetical protein LDENG_00074490 [Lucifuga dentata]